MTVALIPYFSRPEMLYHCLDRISKADGIADVKILLKPDHGMSRPHEAEHRAVLSQFIRLNMDLIGPARHHFRDLTKQSANVLKGLEHACKGLEGEDIVHLIEDDVMIGPDHFTWSAEVHKHGGFCVITSENCNGPNLGKPDKPEGYYSCQGQYRGIGASFRVSTIRNYILPHANPDYYSNPKAYIRQKFDPDPFGGTWLEQDGLIRRIQMKSCMPIYYANTPKSYHAGYYGKNRRSRVAPKGKINQRIDQVGAIIYDPEAMRKACQNEAYYQDSKPISFATSPIHA